jgi:hypothetical protein
LEVSSTMNIVGAPGVPKSEIVVVGGINFTKGIPGNCHLQHLTLRQAKQMGVLGDSSFTMDDVLVEQCRYGVLAYGTGVVGRCTNVEVRQCRLSGVYGWSSFTMDDVLVEQCGYGVWADGTGVVGRCTNVEVRQCALSGMFACTGASITLIGAKTTVHHNSTKGDSNEYGLRVYGSSSTIQLASPLTKEQVSLDNGGGGNWGAEGGGDINQIKTISQ